jgi:signal transduction histidine kinase
MTNPIPPTADLTALAAHLGGRREAILEEWRRATEADPDLTTGASLPRTQFRNHIPHLLDALARALRTPPGATAPKDGDPADGTEHGLQRWQQGYRLAEVVREWGHLHRVLEAELDGYADRPGVGPAAVHARRVWTEMCWRGVSESAAEYHRLHQAEAAGQARDLERALAELGDLDRRRAEAWREAAHDLRGSVGTVTTATAVVTAPGVPDPVRARALDRLQRNVAALQEMLGDLMGLARLEAGHERREVRPFDAAALLTDLCEAARPAAAERGLSLTADGPLALPVEGDAVKVRRVAQNLLLNALKYTTSGGVWVSWAGGGAGDGGRWSFAVRDTGPGFHAGPGTPLAGALEEATTSALADGAGAALPHAHAPVAADPRPVRPAAGEGVGLSIVKRLCELLDATLELESAAGVGSTFRVRLPIRYDDPV